MKIPAKRLVVLCVQIVI
ncbi:hypothetical protein LINPERHAP2_LOCUS45957 [Linum perenne]